MPVNRQQIIDKAREYLGVRFRHQGRGASGIDCAGLITCVAHDLSIFEFDTTDYAHTPNAGMMQHLCNKHLVRRYTLAPGSVLLMRFNYEPQHLAIATSQTTIIHALMEVKRVIEQDICAYWPDRIVAIYDYPEVKDGAMDGAP